MNKYLALICSIILTSVLFVGCSNTSNVQPQDPTQYRTKFTLPKVNLNDPVKTKTFEATPEIALNSAMTVLGNEGYVIKNINKELRFFNAKTTKMVGNGVAKNVLSSLLRGGAADTEAKLGYDIDAVVTPVNKEQVAISLNISGAKNDDEAKVYQYLFVQINAEIQRENMEAGK